ncbi:MULTISPECIES: phosphoribosyltransferase [Methanobacterium]|jgi:predicted phosphoribosyltransferase|uniref:Phosphoribosyltransferase family protein n=1 Tax=Methanobacterium veterum TaxID=408577 RepID=A0A9E5A420_9EURY|nr:MULTISPECIES: phosphoribosyltransferase family protein [Methanobacterium]MCZ3366614.1 phosphoribosyltransferase family protein [Methanobacterium veterum]MCZ3374242.1 phosphoribosyltransferase family protein [Methanobacterium veterum]
MVIHLEDNFFDVPDFRNRTAVFRNREHAGEILSEMLMQYKNTEAIVFAIPAGGVPVGAVVASKLQIPLDIAVVSKITLPWNTEAGYGAVAFDGTVRLNEDMISRIGLKEEIMEAGIEQTRNKVRNRVAEFRGGKPPVQAAGRPAVLVDDGIASGFTMLVAVEALRKAGANRIIIAVPTANLNAVEFILPNVEEVYCANLRNEWAFAVADAYQHWSDVGEEEVTELLGSFRNL